MNEDEETVVIVGDEEALRLASRVSRIVRRARGAARVCCWLSKFPPPEIPVSRRKLNRKLLYDIASHLAPENYFSVW